MSLTIAPGEVLGLVGESGSGKTTVGLAVLGHARKGARITAGRVEIGGRSMLGLERRAPAAHAGASSSATCRRIRARRSTRRCASSSQIIEVLEAHDFGGSAAARRDRLREVMTEVLLPSTPEFLRRYPHQLSGGQQQRVGLAMAFACRPSVIVLDEPTTGLDVSAPRPTCWRRSATCASSHGVAALYVTHDLAVVANLADRVAVMYAGRVVEQGPTHALFADPAHPYTRHLIAAVPDMAGEREIVGLRGRAPSPGQRPVGCAFAPRCEAATDECRAALPGGHAGLRRPQRALLPPAFARGDGARGDEQRRRAPVPAPTPRSTLRDVSAALHRTHGRPRRRPARRPRRVPRPGRRVRLGQDDGVPLDRRPAPRVDRGDPARTARPSPARRAIEPSPSG